MGNNIYLNLDKKWFDKNKEKFLEASNEGDAYLIDIDPDKLELTEMKAEDGKATWSFDIDQGFVSWEYTPTNEDYENLAVLVIKRMNKMKTALEALNE